jgi:carbon-monoxide dehydrogenase large subunit
MTSPTGIGARLLRKEDARFVQGKGRYVADIVRPRQTFGVFVRSPHAHARLRAIDTVRAAAMPDVVAVLTHADLAAAGVGPIPCGWGITDRNGQPMKEPARTALASDKVRCVGDAVALVIAETLAAARDAAEAVDIDYEPLPAAVDLATAADPAAAQIFDDVPLNTCYDWELGDRAATEAAFARAAHVARVSLVNNRLVGNPMEPRAAVAEHDAATGQYTLWTTSQFPHIVKLLMGLFVLKIPQHKLRVIAPDVGGGFGVKQFHYPEEAVVTFAAAQTGRPVKWVAERTEGFVSDAHGRDHVTEAALALDADGRFIGLKVSTIANMGGYLSTFGPNIPTNLYGPLLAGPYCTPAIHCEVKGVFTNTQPVDAYRGAGRPEATFVLERLVDIAATGMGIDKVAIRQLNMIDKEQYPYKTPVLMEYDSGDPKGSLDKVLVLADWTGFAARKAASAARGKLRGIGLSTYVEACGLAPSRIAASLGARGGLFESATVRVHPTGDVTVLIGTHNHGQGHETTFAQIVSDKLGLPADRIEIVFGDTDKVQFGLGTYGSRSLAVGGTALVNATEKVIAKGRKIAAHMLESAETDIVFEAGAFTVTGTDKAKSFAEIALSAHMPVNYPLETLEPGLEEQAFYDPVNFTFPGGAHVAEIEIDPVTGKVALVGYSAVDDVGTIINPMIVEGQIHGGVAQGVGQALMEACVFDRDSGQMLSGSFLDYTMPRADDLPNFRIDHHLTACTHTALGVKGVGETGTIASPAAVINAVVDAMGDFGVTHIDMPATPARVWQVLQAARMPKAAE